MSTFRNKKLGQVFLWDKNIIDKIVKHASVNPTDHVLEVGCGNGILSVALAEQVSHLDIIEIDPNFLEETKTALASYSNITYHLGDVLKLGIDHLSPAHFKIVANIPYQISSDFLILLSRSLDRVQDITIMVQEAFAAKLLAQPGDSDYTSLTLYTQFHYDTTYLFPVSRNCFRPVPRVDSAVIRLKPKHTPPFPVENKDFFFNMIRSGFWGRRKTYLNCLKQSPYLDLPKSIHPLDFFKERPTIRAEKLSLEDFYQLYQELQPYASAT